MSVGAKPRTFLFVHGACHGAWCWEQVLPIMQARGHRAMALDLPGRDSAGWRHTLRSYGEAIVRAASAAEKPVIAVGHSMGGQMISEAAEIAPERFERLVYLSAFLPVHGDSIASMSKHNKGSDLASATKVSLLRGRLEIIPERAPPVFYGDCDPDAVSRAIGQLVPESVRPSLGRIRLTERFNSIPRSYIRLAGDRAISPALQDWMLSRQPCERVATLGASHSPFLSMPEALCDAIESVACQ